MTPNELWKEYCKTSSKEELLVQVPEAWSFGVDADRLADLVARGIKTATSSAHALYALLGEELPIAEGYDIIVNREGEAVCIIETTKVYVTPFSQVSAHHAWKEGEYRPLATEKGDRISLQDNCLAHWRQVHETCFRQWLEEAGLSFSYDSLVVCEEFELVYPKA